MLPFFLLSWDVFCFVFCSCTINQFLVLDVLVLLFLMNYRGDKMYEETGCFDPNSMVEAPDHDGLCQVLQTPPQPPSLMAGSTTNSHNSCYEQSPGLSHAQSILSPRVSSLFYVDCPLDGEDTSHLTWLFSEPPHPFSVGHRTKQ